MSELESFRIIQGDTGGYGAPSYKCDPDGNRLEEWGDICEVYDRGEVDSYLYEKNMEIRRLKRALYKACANWASSESCFLDGYAADLVEHKPAKSDKLAAKSRRFEMMEVKCNIMVERYK